MNMKKVLAGAVASVMAVSSMAIGTCAAAEDEGGFTKLEVVFKVNTPEVVEFEWELAGQLDVSFNADIDEWPAGATGKAKSNEEVTAVWEFDDYVKLATNYFGFKTVGVAWSSEEGAVNPTMDIISFKVDGREIAVDNDIFHKNHTDNDSANGNLKAVFYNAWDANISGNGSAIDVEDVNKGNPGGNTGSTEATEATEAPATDATQAGTDAPTTTPDKNQPDTGVEGVAVVAGLAVLATGAIVIAKKRK